MLSVNIEFCPLDWYTSSQQQLFYTRECICVNASKQSPKAQKKMRFT